MGKASETRLSSLPTLDANVVAVMELSLSEVLTRSLDCDVDLRPILTETLGKSLRERGHANCAEALEARLKVSIVPRDVTVTEIASAVGRAAGQFCGAQPVETRWQLARKVFRALPECAAEFASAAEDALRNTSGASHILLSTLQNRASNFASNPRGLIDAHQRSIDALGRSHSLDQPSLNLWRAPPYLQLFFVHDPLAFDLLRRVDLSGYMKLLSELPHLEIVRQVIERAVRTAPLIELAELLRHAPPAFDQQGRWLSTGALAPLLLAACVNRWFETAEHYPVAVVTAPVRDHTVVDAECGQILKCLGERSDGVPLAYAWLQFLFWDPRRTRMDRNVDRDNHSSLGGWLGLLHQVGRSLPIRTEPVEWVRDEDPLWRNDRIYALVTVLVSQTPPNGLAIAQLLQSCLTNGWVGSHDIEKLAVDPESCKRPIVGLAVASIEDPVGWFKEVWTLIFPNRDQARRSYRAQNDAFENVAQVVVFWALVGLERLPPTSPVARALWVELELAVRESSLTDAFRMVGDPWCIADRRLAALWISLFTDDPTRGAPGSLDDFLLHRAQPDGDFAYLVFQLARSGVTAAQFKRSIPHGDLLRAALSDAQRFNQRTRRPPPELKLEELATAVDALPQPNFTPGSEHTS